MATSRSMSALECPRCGEERDSEKFRHGRCADCHHPKSCRGCREDERDRKRADAMRSVTLGMPGEIEEIQEARGPSTVVEVARVDVRTHTLGVDEFAGCHRWPSKNRSLK